MSILSLVPLRLDRDSRSLKIATSFVRMGFHSRVIELKKSNPASHPKDVEVDTLWPGKRMHEINNTAAKMPNQVSEVIHFCRFIVLYFIVMPIQAFFIPVQRVKLYYLHEYRLFPLVKVLQIRNPAPIIYDAHDFYTRILSDAECSWFWRHFFTPVIRLMDQCCTRYSDHVVTTSDGYAQLFQDAYGVTPTITYNAHEERLDTTVTKSIKSLIGLDHTSRLIVVTGHYKTGAAINALLYAMIGLPSHIHLAFVGRGYETITDRIITRGLQNRCHLMGPCLPYEIVPFISEADLAAVIYFPMTDNYNHSLPNGLFQSVAAKLPIALSNTSAIMNFGLSGHAYEYMDTLSSDSIREALLKLLSAIDNKDELNVDLALNAKNFSWRTEEDKLTSLVLSLIEK